MLFDGYFDFDGFRLGPNTAPGELASSGLNMMKKDIPDMGVSIFKGIVSMDGSKFMVDLYFRCENPWWMLLWPVIPVYPSSIPANDRLQKERFRYTACARWLTLRMGVLQYRARDELGYEYECGYRFDWGSISAVRDPSRRFCDKGYLFVRFGNLGVDNNKEAIGNVTAAKMDQ